MSDANWPEYAGYFENNPKSSKGQTMTNQLNVVYLDKFDLLSTLGQKVQSLFANVAEFSRKRAAYNELMRLDNRMLADIGIERGNVQNAVNGR